MKPHSLALLALTGCLSAEPPSVASSVELSDDMATFVLEDVSSVCGRLMPLPAFPHPPAIQPVLTGFVIPADHAVADIPLLHTASATGFQSALYGAIEGVSMPVVETHGIARTSHGIIATLVRHRYTVTLDDPTAFRSITGLDKDVVAVDYGRRIVIGFEADDLRGLDQAVDALFDGALTERDSSTLARAGITLRRGETVVPIDAAQLLELLEDDASERDEVLDLVLAGDVAVICPSATGGGRSR